MTTVAFICVCINISKRYTCTYYLYTVHTCPRAFDTATAAVVTG